MKAVVAKSERIEVSVSHATLKEMRSVVEREQVIRLSRRDWNWLLDLTEAPPKPNKKLQAAMNRYKLAGWQ
jgi:uncharacterized protein (DUF1778 family)